MRYGNIQIQITAAAIALYFRIQLLRVNRKNKIYRTRILDQNQNGKSSIQDYSKIDILMVLHSRSERI